MHSILIIDQKTTVDQLMAALKSHSPIEAAPDKSAVLVGESHNISYLNTKNIDIKLISSLAEKIEAATMQLSVFDHAIMRHPESAPAIIKYMISNEIPIRSNIIFSIASSLDVKAIHEVIGVVGLFGSPISDNIQSVVAFSKAYNIRLNIIPTRIQLRYISGTDIIILFIARAPTESHAADKLPDLRDILQINSVERLCMYALEADSFDTSKQIISYITEHVSDDPLNTYKARQARDEKIDMQNLLITLCRHPEMKTAALFTINAIYAAGKHNIYTRDYMLDIIRDFNQFPRDLFWSEVHSHKPTAYAKISALRTVLCSIASDLRDEAEFDELVYR